MPAVPKALITDVCVDLEDSRRLLQAALADVSESEASLRLTPESWSILGIVEHVVVAEGALLQRLASAEPSDTRPRDAEREARFAIAIRSRSERLEAPRRAHPAGRFATLGQALERFNAARQQTIAFARERHADLHRLTASHPFFGSVNGAEMLLIMAAHSSRHADQILEIRLSGRATVP